MGHSMNISAWGSCDGDTEIRYSTCQEGSVELLIGGDEGLNLMVTDAGLARLASVVNAACSDERRLRRLRRHA